MKIGIVCYPTFGGSGVVATELGMELANKGHQVHFISYSQPFRLDRFSGNLFYHGPTAAFGQTLAVDTSVPGNLTWFATTGWGNTTAANDGTAGSEAQRLGDWISDKYDAFGTVPGAGYEIKVYDRNDTLITKSDDSNWLFDYQTGILIFNNNRTTAGLGISTSGPFKIVGWRYIGPKGIIPASYGGLGYTSYNLGDLVVGAGSTIITLPVGTNNYILSADSSTPSGLRWVANSGGGGTGTGTSVYIGETPPAYSSNAGDLWYNSENGALNIYYTDVDTSQWVEINSAFGGVEAANIGFGITQLNGLSTPSQFLYAGFDGNTFNISSTGNSHTFNIPIAGVGFTGLVSGFAQTFGGVKTFQNGLVSGNGVTIYGSLSLPSQPLSSVYGGTGKTLYNLGDLLVGAGTSLLSLPVGTNGYVLQSNSSFQSGLGWTYVSNVNVSETAPTPAITGDLWWNSVDGSLSVYFIDVDSTAQWVEIGNGPSQGSFGTTTGISSSYFLASYGYLETVYDYGTSSGSITPNWNDGSIQKIILNGGLSLNVPINMQSGSTMKLIVRQNASGNNLLTPNSSLKFKGGNKTLSTSSNAIDMIKIYYDGTNFLCDLDLAYS